MANGIDPSVLLRGVVPDAIGAASRGFKLGQSIRNAPLLRRQKEQELATSAQQAQAAKLQQGQNQAIVAFQLFGSDPFTVENFNQRIATAESQGIVLSDAQKIPTPQNINTFNQVLQAGGQLSKDAGGREFADKAVFTERIIQDPDTGEDVVQQGFAVRDAGTNQVTFEPIQGQALKETPGQKRQLDAASRVKTEQNIVDIKNSGDIQTKKEVALNRERQELSSALRRGANTARRSRSNLLRVRRALEAVSTGRLAAGRNLLGNILPAVKDANAEKFQSLATQFALDELSKQSGTKTDFDFQKAAETQARLGNTKEANRDIVNIALDRIDEIEDEERQQRAFVKAGNNAEDFQFKPVPVEFIALMRANKDNEQMRKDFKSKYKFLPTGI